MVCEWCDQEVAQKVSCTQETFDDFPDEIPRGRIRYGDEERTGPGLPFHCVDCSTPVAGFHHPGCAVERCPFCKTQAITCGCMGVEDEDVWDIYQEWQESGHE